MKTNVTGIPALALALCLLLAACGGQGASPSEAPPEDLPPEETALVPSGFPELEETEWEAVSVDLESFGISQTLASCRERYPSGRIAELLDVMEQEHAASMERNHGQSQ